MTIDYAVKVDIGVKETNDDRVLVSGRIVNESFISGECVLPDIAVVCDGCGGYAGGDIAAQTVLELLQKEKSETLLDANYLADVLDKCQEAVFRKKKEMPQFSGMCTTIAGCIFGEEGMVIFHAGDSRVYRYDGINLAQMTVDHSVVQQMVDMGEITEKEALSAPYRNVINRCIGVKCPPPDIYISASPIAPGEKYLLCSDGLWEYVQDEEIIEILSDDLALEDMANKLVALALSNGSEDNISVCICGRQGRVTAAQSTPFILD